MSAATPKQYVRSGEAVLRPVAGENLLVPIRGALADMECVFATTEVGAAIWDALEQPLTLAELVAQVTERFAVDADTAQQDSEGFLVELTKEGLVREVEA